jgi:uncharacterized protein YprB with RNaseH-like and TPR domain
MGRGVGLPVEDKFKERLGGIVRGRRTPTRRRKVSTPATLEELPGAVRTEGLLVVERSVRDLSSDEDLAALLEKVASASAACEGSEDVDEELGELLRAPERALFFDTETTGLGGNMVFMLGTMRVGQGDIRLTQVFARDYREERELLAAWLRMLSESGMLVSFNGKSFDAPVLRDRLALHGFPRPEEPPHVDLLHHSRRRWRGEFPDCRLQTLEWKVCGRRRSGDIPGEEIPGVYHHFVRTGQTADILTVFHHNALDLITLADIAVELSKPR